MKYRNNTDRLLSLVYPVNDKEGKNGYRSFFIGFMADGVSIWVLSYQIYPPGNFMNKAVAQSLLPFLIQSHDFATSFCALDEKMTE